jgi:hypothetical protein
MNITGGLIVFWLICGGIAAAIGSAKNRGALAWFIYGALFAPSVLIVAFLPKLPPKPPPGLRSVTCPRCNAVQNIPQGQTAFECWQCKLVNDVAGAGYVAGASTPKVAAKATAATTEASSIVRCHICQHTQREPLSASSFQCGNCKANLKRQNKS